MSSLPALFVSVNLLLSIQLLIPTRPAWAWVPPYPNSKVKWESVHDMRRRLNMTYNYTPQHIHPELCRHLTEEDCEFEDRSMREQQLKNRRNRRNLQGVANPKVGSIKALVLMVRFTDHTNRPLLSKKDIITFWTETVPEWIDVNSQGRYDLDATVIDWTTTDNTEAHYTFGKMGITSEGQQMAWPILEALEKRPNWDWSEFDGDNDGRIDSLVLVHSGYGAETTTTDCFGRDFQDRIWAHAFTGTRDPWTSKDGTVKTAGYTVASAFAGDCGTEPGKIGLTVHEYMHTLGLEDLYDGVDPLVSYGTGAFDIMSYPYGQGDDEDNPGHLSPWSKVLAEWLEPVEITTDGIYTLKPAETSDEAYRINLNNSPFEYFLIEHRKPLEFDIDIWASGLVIYHIDDLADLQNNVGHPGQAGWPGNGKHYQVAVVQADGNYDIEKGVNHGDAADIFQPGDVLGPGMGGSVYPNTDSYQGGFITETGLTIKVLSQTDSDITFEVEGLSDSKEPTAPSAAPSESPSIAPTAGTGSPSSAPSQLPTANTASPSLAPSSVPSKATESPSSTPTQATTANTASPSLTPSAAPSNATKKPSSAPTQAPTANTASPTLVPSAGPSIAAESPSSSPTQVPTANTASPTLSPSTAPSNATKKPSSAPTQAPTADTAIPTLVPSARPSIAAESPSSSPTQVPTANTASPTLAPSTGPSAATESPASTPSETPTTIPSASPSMGTKTPTKAPTQAPATATPTATPSAAVNPTSVPTMVVTTANPTALPTVMTASPTSMPTGTPTVNVSGQVQAACSNQDDLSVCVEACAAATCCFEPFPERACAAQNVNIACSTYMSCVILYRPTASPTVSPSKSPTPNPTLSPTKAPTRLPTISPSSVPSSNPTESASGHPSIRPTLAPTGLPSKKPTNAPSMTPSVGPTATPTVTPPSYLDEFGGYVMPTLTPTVSRSPTETPTLRPTATRSPIYLDAFKGFDTPSPNPTGSRSPAYLDSFEEYKAETPAPTPAVVEAPSYLSSSGSSAQAPSAVAEISFLSFFNTSKTKTTHNTEKGMENKDFHETETSLANQNGKTKGYEFSQDTNLPQTGGENNDVAPWRDNDRDSASTPDSSSQGHVNVKKMEDRTRNHPPEASSPRSWHWLAWVIGTVTVLVLPAVIFQHYIRFYSSMFYPETSLYFK